MQRTERYAVWVWYVGERFAGFQTQVGARTVQSVLSAAFVATGAPAVAMPAGRTDKGVHARMQVVSAKAPRSLSAEEFAERVRSGLPEGELGIALVRPAHPSFHAQWSANRKEYRYRFALGAKVPAEWAPFAWHVEAAPERVAEALQRAVGTRDFIAFHVKSSVRRPRTLQSATLHELKDGVFEARFVGDRFARNQVRYLAGVAAQVARGELSLEEYGAALDHGEAIGGVRAPAEGLVLWEVGYPAEVDPFSAEERSEAPGVPRQPPFYCVS